MIDLEVAFHNVARKAAFYKLWSAGVRGRMLLSINSFLDNHFSRCLVNTKTSEWIETTIGVLQGSLLAVILFVLHISDMTAINAWATDKSPTAAAAKVQEYLCDINQWNTKWRLLLSKEKTKVICFSKQEHHKVSIMIDT